MSSKRERTACDHPFMPVSHLLLALAVVFVWGTNFVVIKWGLAEFPPFLLAALRFTLSAFPFIFFIPRPKASWASLAAFGLFLGAGQFGLLFYAMRADVTPGLASLIMQSQVFFTIGLAMLLQRERLSPVQAIAMVLAVSGIALIGWESSHAGQGSITAKGLLILLCAAFSWALANITVRRAGKVDALAFIVWSSPFCLPVLYAVSFAFHGTEAIVASVEHATWLGWASVLWQTIGNTLFAFAAWNWLMARHPAATVTPTALLIPIFGMGASALVLGEPLQGWKITAAALVIGGLALNLYAGKLASLFSRRPASA
jgi:O-acetylserine/cysteine efflux transporter